MGKGEIRMRKYIGFVFVLVCVFALAGCSNKTAHIEFPFEVSDVENVEMYHFIQPAEAEKKVITESKDIQAIYQTLERISLKDKETEPAAGGSVTSFRFHLSDGTSYEVTYSEAAVKAGRIITTGMEQDFFTAADIQANWKNFDYEVVPVEESELPQLYH